MSEGSMITAADFQSLRTELMGAVQEWKGRYEQELAQLKTKGVVDPEVKEAIEKAARRMDDLEAKFRNPGGSPEVPPLSKSLTALFVESDNFQAWKQRNFMKGGVGMKVKNGFFPQYLNRDPHGLKTTITTDTAGIADQAIRGPMVPTADREFRIRDLIRSTPITVNSVEYPRETGFTNAASPQSEGGAKAESAISFELADAPVRTIAHWIPASKQVLDDTARLQEYIERRMLYMLLLVEERQLLLGDGTGQNLEGLMTAATAYDTARNGTGDSYIDTISHAETQVSVAEFAADGIVLNPNDWEVIRLKKTEEGGTNKGSYLLGPASGTPNRRLWNVAVVVTNAMPEGEFLVGAFGMGAEIFDRQDATIDVSTEHSDFFVKNLVAIRAEERIALAIYRPEAFVTGAFV